MPDEGIDPRASGFKQARSTLISCFLTVSPRVSSFRMVVLSVSEPHRELIKTRTRVSDPAELGQDLNNCGCLMMWALLLETML